MSTDIWLPAGEWNARAARERTRLRGVLSLAATSGVLAFCGMWLRYGGVADDVVPIVGMNQWAGQIGWAVLLVAALIMIAQAVQEVVAQRLQWAILISLVLHLLLCVSLQTLAVSARLNTAEEPAEIPGRPLEQLTLPDHGEQSEAPAWQQPSEVAIPERPTELDRQAQEVVEVQRADVLDPVREMPVEKADLSERPEDVRLAQDAAVEVKRQVETRDLQVPAAVALPEVRTREQQEIELKARAEQARTAKSEMTAERRQTEIAAATPQIEAVSVEAQRTEMKPQQNDVRARTTPRAATAAQAALPTVSDAPAVASAAPSRQVRVQEDRSDLARQQSAAALSSGGGQPVATNAPTSAGAPSAGGSRAMRAQEGASGAAAAPSAGGSAAMARNAGRTANSPNAAGSAAPSVAVASATGVGAPRVGESAAATQVTRGTAASVPLGTGSSGGSVSRATGSSTGIPVRGTGGIARAATGNGQPQLGDAGGSGLTSGVAGPGASANGSGTQTGRGTGAVGTEAGSVNVATTGTSRGNGSGVLGSGPAGTSVGRQTTGLPSRSDGASTGAGSGIGPGNSTAPSSGTGLGVGRGTGGTGLASRGTEPSARLGTDAGFASGSGTGLSTARRGTDAALPSGADAAEQSGSLVIAGPQSAGTGALKGPQMTAVPRRSAGLPGSGGPGGTGAVPLSTSAIGQPGRSVAGGARGGIGDERPTLASAEQVAGLIKRSAPGIGVTTEAKLAASLSLRTNEARREAAKSLGGSTASEEAVERGLTWLVRHQHDDGHWSIHQLACRDHACSHSGSFQADTAATGLALLSFLGAGYTHQSGPHQAVVSRGLKWLIQHQKPTGDLFADESDFVWFYSHGMAAIALCEAYGMTKDAALQEPAQRALNFIVESQHPQFGGWRYRPRFESDTSVSGWQLMALKSGEMSGLSVPSGVYSGVGKWLASVESKSSPGQFTYHPSRPASPAMTAEGLLMRQYLGAKRNDPALIAGANFLRTRLPDLNERDAYYWYYGTQVMFHMQGEHWSEWNARLRDTLVNGQLKDGGSSGSWNPDRPTAEKWSAAGGRHYLTCLNLLMLEVYYRHLPLYVELEK